MIRWKNFSKTGPEKEKNETLQAAYPWYIYKDIIQGFIEKRVFCTTALRK